MNTQRIFNHYVHVKFLKLGLVQFAVLIASVYIAALVRFAGQNVPLTAELTVWLPKALMFTVVIMFSMAAMGVYHPQLRDGHLQVVIRVFVGFVFGVLALSIVFYLFPSIYLGRGVFAMACVIGMAGTLATKAIFFLAIDRHVDNWRVLFYGAGENASTILEYLRRRSDRRLFTLAGCVLVEGETPLVETQLVRRLKTSLLEYARQHRIDEVVVVMDDLRRNFPASELLECRMAGINVIDTVTFYERQTGKIKTELLRPSWIIFSNGFHENPLEDALKRVMDIAIATVLLLVFSPLMLLTAAAILLEDGFRQPVFFSQLRVGRGGREFSIYKFRSMRTDAEAEGIAQWATTDDPRVTRVGRHLRKYRLDELPQLINVLKGEMSMVGPRPERPAFVAQLAEALPYYRVRERVKPGITGWAQLGYPYGASEDDANGKLQLDLYYVKNRGTFLDLLILVGTTEVVLFRKGGR